MEKGDADSVTKTVFKKNVGQSFIQLQFKKVKRAGEQDKQQERDIEELVDFNSAVLSRKSNMNKRMVTLKRLGYLYNEKERGGIFSCFCVGRRAESVELENRVLWVKSSDGVIIETVNFDTVSVSISRSGNSITIETLKKEKAFYLEVTPHENPNEWEESLRNAIDHSLGQLHQLTYLSAIPRFWMTQSIAASDFSEYCNSGDIILMKSTHGMAKFQRGVTGSEYDHIALVLRNSKDEVLLFESNSDTGVAITFWKDMLRFKWYEAAEKVVYRALGDVERGEGFLTTLQGFVADNLDKKFGIGIGKLMKFTSKFSSTKQESENRTFFCSELVAKVYKQLGLLDPNKSSTQYWPGCFSQQKILPLLKGSLGPQKIICFDRDLCRKK